VHVGNAQKEDKLMLVFGVISPHPPIIIPEIGGTETEKAAQTISALETAGTKLTDAKPDKLIIISPHSDHGYAVPLYYLAKQLPLSTKLEQIRVIEPSYEYYFNLGKEYGAEIDESDLRTAIIASADLSHVLKDDGPYGFNPAGPKLDEAIVKAVREKDPQSLLELDPALLEEGAECGLRSILFLLGVFAGKGYSTEVLSYEGPFGVGYMVATFETA
jgi:aromatic ring-opening dioxygenase LigB subunit